MALFILLSFYFGSRVRHQQGCSGSKDEPGPPHCGCALVDGVPFPGVWAGGRWHAPMTTLTWPGLSQIQGLAGVQPGAAGDGAGGSAGAEPASSVVQDPLRRKDLRPGWRQAARSEGLTQCRSGRGTLSWAEAPGPMVAGAGWGSPARLCRATVAY